VPSPASDPVTSYKTFKLPPLIDNEVLPAPAAGLPSTIRYAAMRPVSETSRFGALTEAAVASSLVIRARSSVPVVASPIRPAGGEEQLPKVKQGVNWLSLK
jgi:hypothetical protein